VANARGIATIEELNREYQAKLAEAARRQYTSRQLVDDWLKVAEVECVSDTLKAWRKTSKHLVEYCERQKLHLLSIDRTEAQRYVSWLPTADYEGRTKKGALKATSVLLHILQGSSLFNYLRDVRGLATQNPFFPLIRVFKRKNRAALHPDLRALDEGEVAQLLLGCESLDDFLTVLGPFKLGVRREEFAGIRMDRIDWQSRTIELDPHPRRTYLRAYFDEELEFFLRLKVERNKRDHPGNPYLMPSPQGKNRHITANQLGKWIKRIVANSPLAKTVKNRETEITMHTARRSFTSCLKRKRPTAPSGCPSHIVAVLRGDSLLSRNENTPDTTQGHYTKFGKVEGIPEVRYWYDRCMPVVGAREIWERAMPSRATAQTVAGLLRAVKAGAV